MVGKSTTLNIRFSFPFLALSEKKLNV